MNETIPKKAAHTVAILPLLEEEQEKARATDMIEFSLQQRAGAKSGPSYKVKVRRFCEGTVGQWIDIRKSIAELWTQNGISKPQDQVANVTTILRGDSLTSFEDKVQELSTSLDANGGATKGKGQPHKKSRGSKHRSATPRNGAGAKHYCTEHGQNPTHSTDNCYVLKNRASRGDRTSGSGNKKSFRNEINMILSRDKPRKKFLEMFSTFVEEEQDLMATQKKSAKKPNKAKTKSRRGSRDDDSSESEGEMSIACIDQATDEIDEANSYQSRIENLGTMTDDK
jgi:hypothetical protein